MLLMDGLDQAGQSHPSVIIDPFVKRPLTSLPIQLALLSLTDSSWEAIRSIDTPSNLSSIMPFFVGYVCAADIIFIEMTERADPHHLFTGVRRSQNSSQASILSEREHVSNTLALIPVTCPITRRRWRSHTTVHTALSPEIILEQGSTCGATSACTSLCSRQRMMKI